MVVAKLKITPIWLWCSGCIKVVVLVLVVAVVMGVMMIMATTMATTMVMVICWK